MAIRDLKEKNIKKIMTYSKYKKTMFKNYQLKFKENNKETVAYHIYTAKNKDQLRSGYNVLINQLLEESGE